MKPYQIYFIILKLLVIAQIIAVLLKKQAKSTHMYILTDTLFKLSAGFYLIIFFYLHEFPGLEFEDTIILRFSGVIILFDIDYAGIIEIVSKYSPWLSNKLQILQTIKG